MNNTVILLLFLILIVLIVFLTKFELKLKFKRQANDKESKAIKSKLDNLSNTELKILKSLSEGKSNKELADEFSISVFTVKKHVSNIFKKLNLSARSESRQFKNLLTKK